MMSSLYTDTKFSEQRCQKVLPLALARYQESLPSHYTRAHHETKVSVTKVARCPNVIVIVPQLVKPWCPFSNRPPPLNNQIAPLWGVYPTLLNIGLELLCKKSPIEFYLI